MALDVAHTGFCQRDTRPSPSWFKATDMHIAADMKNIRDELNSSIHYAGYDCISFVNTGDVIHACNKLMLGKRDGTTGLWSDHFIQYTAATNWLRTFHCCFLQC